MSSRGGRHRLTRRTRQELRMRPEPRRRAGFRATARALLSVATGLLLTGGTAAILQHQDGEFLPVAFSAED
ncbi:MULTISPECIES: hypothetical protein [Pseudonocardia]|nr:MULTISPECIES: hypothetical protein [Pseudonocardia]MCF7552018.1 hypothetical protein [Pseudonocardia sp. WMMC193]